eukprot:Hpha_TRINITY_DN7682_c0_g1::TRINITY_DN7682_c0_g1_i1::g.19196::m.19196
MKQQHDRHWSFQWYRFWDECGLCCTSCCCFAPAIAQAKSTFDETSCPLLCLLTTCQPCTMSVLVRHYVRVGYGIHGSCVSDLLVGGLCCICSAVQLTREVESRGSVVVNPRAGPQDKEGMI